MKFTLSMLQEFLDVEVGVSEICERLTEIGLEVEELVDSGASLASFRSVKILSFEKHPDADKLNICQVETVDGQVELICGAANVRKGLVTIFAPIGSIIPSNGMKIKKSKIRGIESNGMLCSGAELGLGKDSDGIIELADDSEVGLFVADVFGLNDAVIEIAITPNRGDCLGVYGIARDLAASGMGQLKEIEFPKYTESFQSEFKAKINSEDALELNFIEVKNSENKESPDWLKKRLDFIGISSKGAFVDVTNYIAFMFGQPMHSYDSTKLQGKVIAANSLARKEEFVALNEQTYVLEEKSLVIQDEESTLALAGIIGGKDSACAGDTKGILLEAANFDYVSIIHTGRKVQIDTDSRYRFERKVDPLFTQKALQYAAGLIANICGGEFSEIITDKKEKFIAKEVELEFSFLNEKAGFEIKQDVAKNILVNLGFKILAESAEKIKLAIPSWRNDVEIKEDLVEEILRLNLFENIPYEAFEILHKKERNFLDVQGNYKLKQRLAFLGLDEVVSWSFMAKEKCELFSLKNDLEIINPINKELSIMRASIIPNLVDLALEYQNKASNSIAIFEQSRVFLGDGEKEQPNYVGLLRYGVRNEREVNNDDSYFDVFDVKNDCLEILGSRNLKEEKLIFSQENLPNFLHPKRANNILLGKNIIGYFGELHPFIANDLGFKDKSEKHRICVCEINLDLLPPLKEKNKIFVELDLQPVNRDFCFIVDKSVDAGAIKKEIFKTEPDLISKVNIFDLYEGDKLETNKKSIAFSVVLQPLEKSFLGQDLEDFNNKVIERILEKFGARLP